VFLPAVDPGGDEEEVADRDEDEVRDCLVSHLPCSFPLG
jgi:hypothetical protein